MRFLGATVGLAMLLTATACGATAQNLADPGAPTPEQTDALLSSLTTWDAGAVAELELGGVTELDAPRDSFAVATDTGRPRVFSRKDPNNGCRLQLVDDELRSGSARISGDAALYDMCHGHSYRLDGTHIDPDCERSLYEYAVAVADGRMIVTLPDDSDPTNNPPTCSPAVGGH